MNSVRCTHSPVNIYIWKYYDLLTKSLDFTDSDKILKKCILVSFIFHILTMFLLPIWISPLLQFIPPLHSSTSYVFSSIEAWTLHLEILSLTHYPLHYATSSKNELKMNFINGFWSIIALLKNYGIFQYF